MLLALKPPNTGSCTFFFEFPLTTWDGENSRSSSEFYLLQNPAKMSCSCSNIFLVGDSGLLLCLTKLLILILAVLWCFVPTFKFRILFLGMYSLFSMASSWISFSNGIDPLFGLLKPWFCFDWAVRMVDDSIFGKS